MLQKKAFQKIIQGKEVKLFILTSKNNTEVAITNYGGRIVGLLVQDKNKQLVDMVVGFGTIEDYIHSTEPYYGALIGRYANRIAKGKFRLHGKEYQLPINNGVNHLHGGKMGFHNTVWEARQLNEQQLQLSYFSPHGEEGYPGNLHVRMIYTLSDSNELKMDYEAYTDKDTPLNLTNHAFFNLNGEGNGSINDHVLMVNADHYVPVDPDLIPEGNIEKTENTPLDFRKPIAIGARIEENHIQLKRGSGYDHNFVLNKSAGKACELAASAWAPQTGILLEVLTTEPGLQFYGGNFMQGRNTFKSGAKDDFRTAFCLEAQYFPDSPNQPQFPGTILKPGETYSQTTIYKFSVK